MAFSNRADLVAAIGAWLNRASDTNFVARIPDFIRLTEVRLNRLLRDPSQIVSTTLAFTNGAATLPADFGQLVAFGPTGIRLDQVSPGEFGTYLAQSGDPRVYSVIGGNLNVLPSYGSASTPITYYRAITPLVADGDSNWLLARAPDVYLYGALSQAEFYGWNDERLPVVKGAFDEAIMELRVDGENRRWGAAPLAAKIRRT